MSKFTDEMRALVLQLVADIVAKWKKKKMHDQIDLLEMRVSDAGLRLEQVRWRDGSYGGTLSKRILKIWWAQGEYDPALDLYTEPTPVSPPAMKPPEPKPATEAAKPEPTPTLPAPKPAVAKPASKRVPPPAPPKPRPLPPPPAAFRPRTEGPGSPSESDDAMDAVFGRPSFTPSIAGVDADADSEDAPRVGGKPTTPEADRYYALKRLMYRKVDHGDVAEELRTLRELFQGLSFGEATRKKHLKDLEDFDRRQRKYHEKQRGPRP